MNKLDLIKLIEGPLACLLTGEITYSRFIELLNIEFPELDLRYNELYPRLFNNTVEKEVTDPECMQYDVWAVAHDYLKIMHEIEKVLDVQGTIKG